jgi:hypothetical protein
MFVRGKPLAIEKELYLTDLMFELYTFKVLEV